MDAQNAYGPWTRRIGVLTQDEGIVFMRSDCIVWRTEGLSARSRAHLAANGRETLARLYQVDAQWLASDEAGLSEAAWRVLGVAKGDPIAALNAPAIQSFADVRRRLFGRERAKMRATGRREVQNILARVESKTCTRDSLIYH